MPRFSKLYLRFSSLSDRTAKRSGPVCEKFVYSTRVKNLKRSILSRNSCKSASTRFFDSFFIIFRFCEMFRCIVFRNRIFEMIELGFGEEKVSTVRLQFVEKMKIISDVFDSLIDNK